MGSTGDADGEGGAVCVDFGHSADNRDEVPSLVGKGGAGGEAVEWKGVVVHCAKNILFG
jgi:hypothetical protein